MITRVASLLLWRALALGSLLLGVVGAVLPVLPTTPFLLVAAWAASHGWPQFEAWLVAHPRWGPPVRRWRDHRAVPRGAKWLASITMLASVALVAASGAPMAVKLALPAVLSGVAWWLWRRAET
ncbi:MAG TPA: YbaN family protein [Burkholderiaceae bacterium]|nr:YbaN family protein [Burkholderiaceae bacterium]